MPKTKFKYDFSGWVTRNDILCTDGRTIRQNAFAHQDMTEVPLVWQHQHNSPDNVIGKMFLENRPQGVYGYGLFNNNPNAEYAKEAVVHGDINAMSIWANHLKQDSARNVLHGLINEVSLVFAGANKGALIDNVVIQHADGSYEDVLDEAEITFFDERIDTKDGYFEHSDEESKEELKEDSKKEETKKMSEEKTLKDVYDTLDEDQKKLLEFMVGKAIEDSKGGDKEDDDEVEHSDYEGENMYHAFDGYNQNTTATLSHADEQNILGLAQQMGSFQAALHAYAEENELVHSAEEVELLFPEYHLTKTGEPEMITTDQTWISSFMSATSKSPYSRLKTRAADVKAAQLRARGYKKGNKKDNIGTWKLKSRTTDPQTVYVKEALDRDDIVDITDFDYVAYEKKILKMILNEELALAAMVGDGREDDDQQKISETYIRSIWNDAEEYTMHHDIDLTATNAELQGTNTEANFGSNYIFAEAVIAKCLHARETFKGTGQPNFYCTPTTLNTMLLARDLNGRRIYNTKTELEAALNVKEIVTVEQFSGLQRKDSDNNVHELLALVFNPADYTWGSTKGGEVSSFDDFDIDYNQQKFLIETRLSGALLKYFSAIAIEKPVA